MTPTLMIVVWWLAFAGSHMTLSSVPIRQRLIGSMGELAFRGLYSAVAFGCLIPLIWTYFGHKHAGPLLWALPPGPIVRGIVYALMAIAFVLLASTFVRPSPAAVVPGK